MLIILNLVFKIGLLEVFYALLYRIHKSLLSRYYKKAVTTRKHDIELQDKSCSIFELEKNYFSFFSDSTLKFQQSVIWSIDPVSKTELRAGAHWSKYDFSKVSDIKHVWEISRFNWWLKASVKLDDKSHARELLADWIENNPYPYSAQWACAQECSIRLINFLLGVEFSKQYELLDEYRYFIEASLKRIKSTHYYALAQKNDHAIAEACAMYLAKIYLNKRAKREKKHLNSLISKLFFSEGSFSMYSLFYHRYVSDCLMYTSYLASIKKDEVYTSSSKDLLKKSNQFLCQLIFNDKGHTPNLGANDGTNPFSIFSEDYRDFRESLSLSMLISDDTYLSDSPFSSTLSKLLNLSPERTKSITGQQKRQVYYGQFGLYIKRCESYTFLIKTHSTECFRPSQEDISHIELWANNENILLDSGSYSYREKLGDEIKSHRAHNCLSESGIENLRVQSKFLYKDWPMQGKLEIKDDEIKYSFLNFKGSRMTRRILFKDTFITVSDKIEAKKLEVNFNVCASSSLRLISDCIPKKEKAFHSSNYNKLEEHERLTFTSNNEHITIISLGA